MKATKYNITLDMVLEYAKIFDQEGKPGDIDSGNPKADQKWLRELAKNPEAKVNAYFTSEEQIKFLEQFPGFENEYSYVNKDTGEKIDTTRIKDGNPDFGIGKYIQLKRKMNDIREFKNKQGQIEEMDKGGVPTVKILSVLEDGESEAYVDYDYDTLGAPSNGTEAKVRFEPRYMRLDAVAITNLIEYIEGDQEDDF